MAYNNGFPVNYQPYYQMPLNGSVNAQNTAYSSGITWVQGEAGAKSYLVAPNTTVQLWDSEKQVIYLKSADASGMPSMKVLDYTIRETSGAPVSVAAANTYVTKDELAEFEAKIKKMIEEGKKDESAF